MAMYSLATYEPYYSLVHGQADNGKLIVIYEYSLDEFYDNEWKSELKLYKRNILKKTVTHTHPLLRNYHKIMKKSTIELVEMKEESDGTAYCILHTYKINILKRIWRKKLYAKIRRFIQFSQILGSRYNTHINNIRFVLH